MNEKQLLARTLDRLPNTPGYASLRRDIERALSDEYPRGYGTHWDGCWRSHLGCCVGRVEQLEGELEHWKANHDDQVRRKRVAQEKLSECRALLDLHPSGDDCIHCGERPATQRGYPFCTVCYYELREQASADEYDTICRLWGECQEKLAAAEAREQVLQGYVEHKPWCPRLQYGHAPCGCGLEQAMMDDHAALDAALEQARADILNRAAAVLDGYTNPPIEELKQSQELRSAWAALSQAWLDGMERVAEQGWQEGYDAYTADEVVTEAYEKAKAEGAAEERERWRTFISNLPVSAGGEDLRLQQDILRAMRRADE